VSLLEQNKINFTIVEYLKTPLTKEEILSLAQKLGKRPKDFIRRTEPDFKDNNVTSFVDDDLRLAEAMERYPKIMERPIYVSGETAVVGRPPEEVLSLIGK
jgi:arsenate reductase